HRHWARVTLWGSVRAREGGVGSLSVRTVLAAAAVLLALEAAAASATAPAAKYPGFKVGAILPTSSHDLGFSQAMTVAARELAKETGLTLSLTDNTFDPTAARPLFQQLLSQHYNLILAYSFSFYWL